MTIGFGCVGLGSIAGGRTWRADRHLVLAALDRGVTLFDTADAYASGSSERILGRALRGRRDDVVVATKGGYVVRDQRPAERMARRIAKPLVDRLRRVDAGTAGASAVASSYQRQDFSPAHVRAAIESSLRRLRTDHIDVYQLHGPPTVLPDLVAELQPLVDAGKVVRLGIGAESTDSALAWSSVDGIGVIQLPFGILDPDGRDAADTVAARSIEVWARGILGGGVLAAFERNPAKLADHPKAALVSDLAALAAANGLGLDELAMGYVCACPGVSAVIVGMSSPTQVERNVALHEATALEPDVLAAIMRMQDRHR